MAVKLQEYSPVFTALVDGSIWADIGKFSDDHLKPFLPLLVSVAFCGDSSSSSADSLLSKICGIPEGNRVLRLLSTDFAAVQADFMKPDASENTKFAFSDDLSKMRILLRLLCIESKDRENPQSLSEDIIVDSQLLLPLLFIHMPDVFDVTTLSLRLLSDPLGPQLLISLVLNSPELVTPVLRVLHALQVSDECARGRQKSTVINALCQLQPTICIPVVTEMLLSRRDCLPAVRIACAHASDSGILSVICPALMEKGSPLAVNITKSMARNTLSTLQERLIRIMKKVIDTKSTSAHSELLIVLTRLQMQCSFKLNTEQLAIFSSFLCRKNVETDSHLVLVIAACLSVHAFVPQHQAGVVTAVDPKIREFFTWISELASLPSHETLATFILYVGILLTVNKTEALSALLSSVLDVKVLLPPRNVGVLKNMFSSACMTENQLAVHGAELPVTAILNSESVGRLPIHAIFELVVAGSFTRYNVDIGVWMEKQLTAAVFPTHPLLPQLVERFAIDCAKQKLPGLSVTFIKNTFTGDLLDESKLPVRCITLLYLLAYRWQLDQEGVEGSEVYDSELYSRVPIRYLLSVVEQRGRDLKSARTSLIRLTTDIYPFMLPTIDSVAQASKPVTGMKIPESLEELSAKCKATGAALTRLLDLLNVASLSDKVDALSCVVSLFCHSLDSEVSKAQADTIISIWCQLENVIPRMLYEKTATSLLSARIGGSIDLKSIYQYPSILFRGDRRVLGSPQHFRCFIHILSFFVDASKNILMRKVHASNTNSTGEAERKERDELSVFLDHTHGSLVVQLLVEVSDVRRMKDDCCDEAAVQKRRDIRRIACEYIHQLFIQDKNLMKLVLFQTLPLHMVPHLVEDIPSMFAAIDFMQEMLTLPNLNRKVFAMSLMVYLARKYKVANACLYVKMVLDTLHTLLKYSETGVNISMFLDLAPALAELINIFPQLAMDVTHLLMRVSDVAKTRLAMRCLVIEPCSSPEKRLIALVQEVISKQVNLG